MEIKVANHILGSDNAIKAGNPIPEEMGCFSKTNQLTNIHNTLSLKLVSGELRILQAEQMVAGVL